MVRERRSEGDRQFSGNFRFQLCLRQQSYASRPLVARKHHSGDPKTLPKARTSLEAARRRSSILRR